MFQFIVLFICSCYGGNIIDVDVDFMDDKKLFELVYQEYFITQKVSNATFYLTITQDDISKYIFFEIYISYPKDGDINFITTIGKNVLTKVQNSTFITTYADYNGYYTHKDYHYIIIPANQLKINDTLTITNLIRNDRRSYQYNLKIHKLDEEPCPKNCSSNSGTCSNGVCSCKENKIDLDCSKDAIVLKFDQKFENHTLNGVQYLYFQQETKLEKIQFQMGLSDNFQQDNVKVTFQYMLENFIYGIPIETNDNYTLSNDERTKSIIIDISELNFNANLLRFNRLLFKLVTEHESQLNFEIFDRSSDNTNGNTITILIIVLTSLAGAFLILIIGCIIQKQRKKKNRNISVIPLCFSEPQPYITLDILQNYLQKSKNGNNECSICLSNDNSNDFILTPCQHPFHIECLLTWLSNRQEAPSCPNCRQEIDFEKLRMNQFSFSQKISPSLNQSTFNLNQQQVQI